MTVVNQNTVGRFDDLLSTFNKINELTKYYDYVAHNMEDNKTKMTKMRDYTKWASVAKMGGMIAVCFLLFAALLAIWGLRSVVAYLVILLVLPAIVAVVVRYIYLLKVIPVAEAKYRETNDVAKQEYLRVYEKLSIQRQNLELLFNGLDEDCRNPLAVYIMRQAAYDGVCQNVFQAQQYFMDRKARLADQQDDEGAQRAVEQLAAARLEAAEQQAFLYGLDEAVAEMIKE